MERQIKINLGSCKRLKKEISSYGKEAEKQRAKIEKMKEDGKDEHDIKQQVKVLEESERMVPDCEKRFELALEKLVKLLAQADEEDDDCIGSQVYAEAKTFVEAK
mmetsp:Transcript_96567/g.133904  ORF Transcript_96567/g.133904 Transcript_96567/m.133904 type:complete len:105 (-) Transcript_96567:12-326(-)